jgi:O-antigen/teichoic acid export membrane protein
MSRLLVRRTATAVGIYSSVVLGVLSSVVATREFDSIHTWGDYSTVIIATGFFQAFFDLTVEESLVKYGFRYVTREDWGRLRRLFSTTFRFKLVGSLLGGIGMLVFAAVAPSRLTVALIVAAAIPLAQSMEGLAACTFFLHGRYDIRAGFLVWSMTLRLAGLAIGAHYGLVPAVAGVLVAQLVATASIGVTGWIAFHRFPHATVEPLGGERREIVSFVTQSSIATGVVSVRSYLAPLLLGAVTSTTQVGLFKIAQAPQQGFLALSAPARMVLLTEQTRDWEAGRQSRVLLGVRRYTLLAAILMVVAVPPLYVLMPQIVHLVYGPTYSGAVTAAQVFLLAAAVLFLVGWTKSFPVAVGRPHLRITTHGLESLVMLPLVVVLGREYGATGAAVAVLVSAVVFAAVWGVIFLRTHAEDVHEPQPLLEAEALEQEEAEAFSR